MGNPRCQVIGDPFDNIRTNGNGQVYFNPAAFAMPALATGPNNSIVGPPVLGNLGGGAGVFTNPHVTNFDMTLTKRIPLGSEKRVLKIQAQAYNVFNHAEFSGYNDGITFDRQDQSGLEPVVARLCERHSRRLQPHPGVLRPRRVLSGR